MSEKQPTRLVSEIGDFRVMRRVYDWGGGEYVLMEGDDEVALYFIPEPRDSQGRSVAGRTRQGASREAARGNEKEPDEAFMKRCTTHHRACECREALMRELAEALDHLVFAAELPGDHCEIEQALPAARATLAKYREMSR